MSAEASAPADGAVSAVTKTRQGTTRSRMADVARLAGVSPSTVSRALRRPEIVSEGVRARIGDAVERLSYRPNLMAGALASARSSTIVVIVPSIINSFFAATVEAMEEGFAGTAYQLMLGNAAYSLEREERLVTSFLSWSPAAIVLTGRRHSRGTVRAVLDAGVPVIEMWEMSDRPIDTVVGFAQRETSAVVVRHFQERGARRLGFVGAAMDRDYRTADRHAGFVAAAERAGYETPSVVRLPDRASATGGAEGLARLLEGDPAIDAVLFSNDAMALGGLFEARRRGLPVPSRLKLCGFGDLEFTVATEPALTTVRPPRREIGTEVARILRERLGGGGREGEAIDLGFELVVRAST